ncbi:MerR family transcriptional regulator [Chitinimonas sp.]|uniref:MerR family transcriptional regulator n=1 Tax=Chitinimonas sp. TaxID=1934313 RepID=UPI0035AF3E7F
MRIAELEKHSGLSRDTLRYYERQGLISPPRRDANGYRDYDRHTLTELQFIQKGKWLGFSLEQLKVAIPSLRQPPERCQALCDALLEKRAAIEADIAEQQARLAAIASVMDKLGLKA